MGYTRLRPAVPLAGALLVATALGVQLAGQVGEQHATRTRGRMVTIAAAIDDPDGLLTRSRGACPDQTFLIRCLEGAQDPDALMAEYRTALSAAAGRTAAARCETVQAGGRLRSCVVRIDEGEHAVMVSIDTRRVGTPQSFTTSGSVIRIDAT